MSAGRSGSGRRWRRWAGLCLVLLAAAASGCREGYLPYYDDAPEAWKVAYDEHHTERILERRALLDRIAEHPRDIPTINELAAEEWNSGRQAEAVRVIDYLLGQLNPAEPDSPATPTAREALLTKVRFLALMAYDAARFATARRLLERFAPADRNAQYGYLTGLLAARAAENLPTDPVACAAERKLAVTGLEAALAQDPRHTEALQLRARLAFEDGDWDRVITLCATWSEVLPQDGRAWYTRGVALQRKQQFDAAIPLFQRAVDLEPEQPDPWFGLAVAHMAAAGDRATADHALREVIRLKPTHAQAYYKLFLLYSEQPVTAERYDLLIHAATLARRDPGIQQALIDTTRAARPERGDLLLFGLQNLMNLELENGRRLNLAPILAYADEAERQGHFEEAFFALAEPLPANPTFEAAHPELGLRLLRLAAHWIDPETGHWNPPAVTLLDPLRPLAAENIGRPVLYKSILDRALYTGRFMFLAAQWSDFTHYGLDADAAPKPLPVGTPSLAEQLPAADREELQLLVARINVARAEHLRRILHWHQVLLPILPFNLKMALQDGPGGAPRPAWPAPDVPAWWLKPEWDAFRQVRVSDLVVLDDNAYNRAVASLSAMGPLLIGELRSGLSRDNYGDLSGGLQNPNERSDDELGVALDDGLFALDILTKMDDPLQREDTELARARHRDRLYLQLQLAPLLPGGGRTDTRLQRMWRSVGQAAAAAPALLAADPVAHRRDALRRDYWFWLMRQNDLPALVREVAQPAAGSIAAGDPFACGVRLWLRANQQSRGAAGAENAPMLGAIGGDLRADLEGMLSGLSSYDSVPALRLRMQISTAVGLAFDDIDLAAAAAENLAHIEAATENGQETQALNLLAMIYDKVGRRLPAVYCLRRSIARIDARQEANAQLQQGLKAARFSSPEEVRLLRWRLLNLWRRLGNPDLAHEQLLAIADYGPDGRPVSDQGGGDKSPARAAALYDLAAERMATGKLSDCYAPCYEAYSCFESANDNIEQYRLTYALIALAANPTGNIERIRESIVRDQVGGAPFKADNARVLEAFDAALQGKTILLLETPELAANYSLAPAEALQLALAIHAARAGQAAAARDHLQQAALGLAQAVATLGPEAGPAANPPVAVRKKCVGIAGLARAVEMLCEALLAQKRGDSAAFQQWRQAWLDQGGLAVYLDGPAASPAASGTPPAPAAANPPIGH